MHMADALLSPSTALTMASISTISTIYALKKTKEEQDTAQETAKKAPLMAILGAFIFAAQMINFTIPATGSSGHITGAILLCALLGPYSAFLVIESVLLMQCLFFADGGLLALGCNIFNMGVVSCFIAYPLIFKPLSKKLNNKSIFLSSVITCIISAQIGAFSVTLETLFSKISLLPFKSFLLLMQPIHLAIGLVEGIVTALILVYILKVSPELLNDKESKSCYNNSKRKQIMATFMIATIIIGGGLSLMASNNPDGLEWSIKKITGETEIKNSNNNNKIIEQASKIQEKTSILPDYDYKNENTSNIINATSFSGLLGGAITFAFALFLGLLIRLFKGKKRREQINS